MVESDAGAEIVVDSDGAVEVVSTLGFSSLAVFSVGAGGEVAEVDLESEVSDDGDTAVDKVVDVDGAVAVGADAGSDTVEDSDLEDKADAETEPDEETDTEEVAGPTRPETDSCTLATFSATGFAFGFGVLDAAALDAELLVPFWLIICSSCLLILWSRAFFLDSRASSQDLQVFMSEDLDPPVPVQHITSFKQVALSPSASIGRHSKLINDETLTSLNNGTTSPISDVTSFASAVTDIQHCLDGCEGGQVFKLLDSFAD